MSKRFLLLPCILILAGLSLAACGGSGGEEAEVKEVIETSATTTDPADCKKLETQKFIEQVSGERGHAALAECEEEAKEEEGAKSVDVSSVEVDGSSATADAALTGGTLDGQAVEVELVKEGDQWKMNELVKFTHFDRAKLVEQIEAKFEEHPGEASPGLTACLLSAFKKGTRKEFEEFFFSESATAIELLAEACAANPSA